VVEQQGERRVGERPHARGKQGRGRRTLSVALAASGFAARSACTTATDELYTAARWRGVYPSCTGHTRRAEERLSNEAGKRARRAC